MTVASCRSVAAWVVDWSAVYDRWELEALLQDRRVAVAARLRPRPPHGSPIEGGSAQNIDHVSGSLAGPVLHLSNRARSLLGSGLSVDLVRLGWRLVVRRRHRRCARHPASRAAPPVVELGPRAQGGVNRWMRLLKESAT